MLRCFFLIAQTSPPRRGGECSPSFALRNTPIKAQLRAARLPNTVSFTRHEDCCTSRAYRRRPDGCTRGPSASVESRGIPDRIREFADVNYECPQCTRLRCRV